VSGATLSCLVSSQDISTTLSEAWVSGRLLYEVSMGFLSSSFSPKVSSSYNPTLCATSLISYSSSSDDIRVRYTLQNRSIIKEDFPMGGEDAQGRMDWGIFLMCLYLAYVRVESLTYYWHNIGLGSIWPLGDNLQSNGCLDKRKPKGILPHESTVFQLSWVGEPVKKIVLKEIGGNYLTRGYFASRKYGCHRISGFGS